MFAHAREAAGTSEDVVEGATVGEVLDRAAERYGAEFAAVLTRCRVWINGDEPVSGRETTVGPDDELAVLPPVSGG
ncbi:MAG TPA: MoaD/ThiS family protein [Acidimicrobiia bacterium]|nr:MoaD/ThiS family protein [Acidimicrobiia bacterium]